jgi:hypothetical protein
MRLAIFIWLLAAAALAPVTAQSNDPFLRTLTEDGPLDRPGLALFLGRCSEHLTAARDGVALLQIEAQTGAPDRPYVVRATAEIRERFDAYAASLGDFNAATAALSGNPGSERKLFRALTTGLHACWRHDSHVELAESYGVNAGLLRSVLASGGVCSRLRHVAFQPRVLEIIDRSLVEARERPAWVEENLALREELAALEQLLEDLRDID